MKEPFKILSAFFIGTLVMRTIYIPTVTIFGVYPQIDNIASMLLLFYILFNSIKKPLFSTLNLPVRYSLYFMFFYLIFLNGFLLIKNIIYFDESFSLLIKRFSRDLVNLYLILYVIHYSKFHKYKLLVIKTMVLTLILLILSSAFATWFISLGFIPNTDIIHGIERNTGFLGMNANGASVFYNIILGFGLSELENTRSHRNKKWIYLLIILSIIGVMLMVSKTGFIILIALFLLFYYRNVKRMRFFIKEGILLLGIMIAIYIWIGDTMTTRIQYQFSGKEDTYSSRMNYNELYLKKAFSDNDIFWYGHTTQAKPHKQHPHNLLVYSFYFGGIFFILILLFLYFKMLWFSISVKYRKYGYVLFPVLMGSLSGFTDYSLWFPILAGLIYENGGNSKYLK